MDRWGGQGAHPALSQTHSELSRRIPCFRGQDQIPDPPFDCYVTFGAGS